MIAKDKDMDLMFLAPVEFLDPLSNVFVPNKDIFSTHVKSKVSIYTWSSVLWELKD